MFVYDIIEQLKASIAYSREHGMYGVTIYLPHAIAVHFLEWLEARKNK